MAHHAHMSGNITTALNSNGTEAFHFKPIAEIIPVTIVIVIMIMVAVVGNLLVILSFRRDTSLQTIYNMYIVNLAVADMSIALFSIPMYHLSFIYDYDWPLGRAMCKVFLVLDDTFCLETVLMMVVLSHDRWILVTNGAHYLQLQTRDNTLIKITVTWVLSFLLYGPAIIGWDSWVGESIIPDNKCDYEFAENFGFVMVTALFEFVFSLILLIIFNILIYSKNRKRSLKVKRAQPKASLGTTITADVSDIDEVPDCRVQLSNMVGNNPDRNASSSVFGKQTSSGEGNSSGVSVDIRRQMQDRKAAKSLSLLVFVFVICYTPYIVTVMLWAWCEECVSEDLYTFFIFLLWSKSSLNPFLYAYSSHRFRRNFKYLLSRCFLKKQSLVS